MIIIIATTGIILAGLIYLLCVTVYFEIGYNIEQRELETGFIKLYPFSYRIRPKIGPNKRSARQSDQEKQKTKKKKNVGIRFVQLIRDDLRTLRQVASNSVKFIQGIVISPDYYLNVSLTGGFKEPHITGWFYGSVCAIQPMLGKSIRLFYVPDFTKESLNGKVRSRLAVRLYSIIREVLMFLWRLPKLRLLRIYFKSRKGGPYGESTD
jgi:hypothetical protein